MGRRTGTAAALLIAAGGWTTSAVAAPVAIQAPASDASLKAACDALALVVLPDTRVGPQTDAFVEAMLEQMFARDQGLIGLEAAFPGLRNAIGAAMKPIVYDVGLSVMPAFRADLSALYQANLTTDEAQFAATEIAKPYFQRTVTKIHEKIDYRDTVGDLIRDKDVTRESLGTDLRAAASKVEGDITVADRTQLIAFLQGPVGRKLMAMNPAKAQIEAKWANYSDPADERRIQQAVEDAMLGHIGLSNPELAEELRKDMAKDAK